LAPATTAEPASLAAATALEGADLIASLAAFTVGLEAAHAFTLSFISDTRADGFFTVSTSQS
jgi:hypothetical protein